MLRSSNATPNVDSQRTANPIVTGGSVVGVKYNGGILVAADTLASYGSLARFEGVERIAQIGDAGDTLLAAGGEYSDYQYMLKLIEGMAVEEFAMDDGATMSPKELHHWLTRVMYNRRSKMDPLWNRCERARIARRPPPPPPSLARRCAPRGAAKPPSPTPPPPTSYPPFRARSVIIAGFRDGAAYLGTSDLYGTMYEDTFIATGLGAHMALPLLRQEWTAEMGEAEARALLTKCMQVLFYRDTRACSTIQIGKVDATGASISAPTKLDTYWEHPEFIKGGGHRGDGSW